MLLLKQTPTYISLIQTNSQIKNRKILYYLEYIHLETVELIHLIYELDLCSIHYNLYTYITIVGRFNVAFGRNRLKTA